MLKASSWRFGTWLQESAIAFPSMIQTTVSSFSHTFSDFPTFYLAHVPTSFPHVYLVLELAYSLEFFVLNVQLPSV
jgi:hypothetical protein